MTTFLHVDGGSVEATPGTFRHTLLTGLDHWFELDELDDEDELELDDDPPAA